MGYYVNIVDCNFTMKKENYDKAYKAVCELNSSRYNDIKRGGRWSDEPAVKPGYSKSVSSNPDKWYSWMAWNYDEICNNIIEVLEMLGFDVLGNESGIFDLCYDGKTGQEDIFFNALAPYIENGSYILWRGEDNDMYVWEFEDGEMTEKDAQITW